MSGGAKNQTSTSTQTIPPEVLARYNAVNAQAQSVASTPFQAYSNNASDFVAQMTPAQREAMSQAQSAATMAQPWFNMAGGATMAGMGPANLGALDTEKYMNPYVNNVVKNTADLMTQQNMYEMSGALGAAAGSGSGFGDRSGIAAANMNRQQNMAMGNVIGNLYSQGYSQALNTAQQQQSADLAARQANLQRQMQGGLNLGQLGSNAQQAAIQGSQNLMAMGTQEQQTEQAGKSALYNQYQQMRAYPFQVAQFLANIAEGTGALSGSTTTTTQNRPFFGLFKDGGKVLDGVSYRRGGLVPESMGGHVGAEHMGEGYADGGAPADYSSMVMQQLFGGMNPAAGAYGQGNAGLGGGIGFVPQANLPVGQLKAPTPVEGAKSADLLNKATDVLTLADKASTAWKDFVPGKSPVDPNAFDIANRDPNNTGTMAAGGAAYARGGLAAGGLPYDPQNSGYVPDNSPQKMPELQQPNNPDGSGQSGLSKLTDMAKFAMMFIPKADGGSVDVVKGDTMSKIAREHGLSLADLEKANPDIRNYDRISIGQHINLPQLAQAAGTPTSGYDPALAQPAGTPTAGYNPSPGLIPAAGTPTEGYNLSAADMFRRSLEAGARSGAAVGEPTGLSAADADRIRSQFYSDYYKTQPVQRIQERNLPALPDRDLMDYVNKNIDPKLLDDLNRFRSDLPETKASGGVAGRHGYWAGGDPTDPMGLELMRRALLKQRMESEGLVPQTGGTSEATDMPQPTGLVTRDSLNPPPVPAAGTPTSGYDLVPPAGTPTSAYDLVPPAGTPTAGYEPRQAAGMTPEMLKPHDYTPEQKLYRRLPMSPDDWKAISGQMAQQPGLGAGYQVPEFLTSTSTTGQPLIEPGTRDVAPVYKTLSDPIGSTIFSAGVENRVKQVLKDQYGASVSGMFDAFADPFMKPSEKEARDAGIARSQPVVDWFKSRSEFFRNNFAEFEEAMKHPLEYYRARVGTETYNDAGLVPAKSWVANPGEDPKTDPFLLTSDMSRAGGLAPSAGPRAGAPGAPQPVLDANVNDAPTAGSAVSGGTSADQNDQLLLGHTGTPTSAAGLAPADGRVPAALPPAVAPAGSVAPTSIAPWIEKARGLAAAKAIAPTTAPEGGLKAPLDLTTAQPVGASGRVPLNEENNNQGNIKDGPFAQRQPGYVGKNGAFAVFKTPEDGRNAQAALLGIYLRTGRDTITKIVNSWSPPNAPGNSPESTANYISYLAKKTGLDPNQPLTEADIPKIMAAQGNFEGGTTGGGGTDVTKFGGNDIAAGRDQVAKAQQDLAPKPGLAGNGDFWSQVMGTSPGFGNAVLPILVGLGKMISSRSPTLGGALLEGIGGGAESMMNRQSQLATIAQQQASTEGLRQQQSLADFKLINGVWQVETKDHGWVNFGEWNALGRPETFHSEGSNQAIPPGANVAGGGGGSGSDATLTGGDKGSAGGGGSTITGQLYPEFKALADRNFEDINNTDISKLQQGDPNYDPFTPAYNLAGTELNNRENNLTFYKNLSDIPEGKSGEISEKVFRPFIAQAEDYLRLLGVPVSEEGLFPNGGSGIDSAALVNKIRGMMANVQQQNTGSAAYQELEALLNTVPSGALPKGAQAKMVSAMMANSITNLDAQKTFLDYQRYLKDRGLSPNQVNFAGSGLQRAFNDRETAKMPKIRAAIEEMFKTTINKAGTVENAFPGTSSTLDYLISNAGNLDPGAIEKLRQHYGADVLDSILAYVTGSIGGGQG